ncbi:MAG: hypothetical protein JO025_25210 [Verrucomicrobia bacterium]|nr:hypothetical protein [Verrucomicrobiota bacterium]
MDGGSLRTATKEHLSHPGRRRPIDPAQKNIPGDAEFRLEHFNGASAF